MHRKAPTLSRRLQRSSIRWALAINLFTRLIGASPNRRELAGGEWQMRYNHISSQYEWYQPTKKACGPPKGASHIVSAKEYYPD